LKIVLVLIRIDAQGRTIWIVDAHGYGKRFIVRADEKLTAFLELELIVHNAISCQRQA
jgi:hypothetical protein